MTSPTKPARGPVGPGASTPTPDADVLTSPEAANAATAKTASEGAGGRTEGQPDPSITIAALPPAADVPVSPDVTPAPPHVRVSSDALDRPSPHPKGVIMTDAANSDPFDPKNLRIDHTGREPGVSQVVRLQVRKPSKQEFFRTNPDVDYRMTAAIVELKEENEIYLLTPAVAAEVPLEYRTVELRLCVARSGNLFIWPVPMQTPGGRENAWHTTAREAATMAEINWVRVVSNMGAGYYDIMVAPAGLSEPAWPDKTFGELLRIAFAGRRIDSVDHPVMKRLLGY
jgi:hypothetical protein